eukprot:COSAG05_NODE_4405_length_1528_cov_20.352797_1_plen_153_part_00
MAVAATMPLLLLFTDNSCSACCQKVVTNIYCTQWIPPGYNPHCHTHNMYTETNRCLEFATVATRAYSPTTAVSSAGCIQKNKLSVHFPRITAALFVCACCVYPQTVYWVELLLAAVAAAAALSSKPTHLRDSVAHPHWSPLPHRSAPSLCHC